MLKVRLLFAPLIMPKNIFCKNPTQLNNSENKFLKTYTMKKLLLLSLGAALVAIVGYGAFSSYQQHSTPIASQYPAFSGKRVQGALGYLKNLRSNQNTGSINAKDYYKASTETQNRQAAKAEDYLQWDFMGPNNVGGRTRVLWIDPNNSNHLIAAGVSGGIFFSTNKGSLWQEYSGNADLPCLTASCITRAANGDLYIGTGEQIFGGWTYGTWQQGASVFPGCGVFKSTDNGATWQTLASTSPSEFGDDPETTDWAFVNDIEASPLDANILLACTSRGIQRTTNGGESWAKVQGVPATATGFDMTITPDGKIHLLAGDSYYTSTDNGENFINQSPSSAQIGKFNRTAGNKAIEYAHSNPSYLYAVTTKSTGAASGCLEIVIRSTDGGTTWEEIGSGGSSAFEPMGTNTIEEVYCQGWYDLALAVDPANANRIFLGGLTLWSWSDIDNWNQMGNLFEFTGNDYYIHADKHNIVFDKNNPNTLFITHDGGISRSDNAQEVIPKFKTINKNYNVTQFYSVGAARDGRMVGGAQDNGTQFVSFSGNSQFNANDVYVNDGGFCEISNITSNAIFASWQSGHFGRSSNGGETMTNYLDSKIDCAPMVNSACDPDQQIDGNPIFITPYRLWEDFSSYYSDETAYPDSVLDIKKYKAFIVTGSGDGKVWLGRNVLNFGNVPTWYNIGRFSGSGGGRAVTSVAVSRDGSTIVAGSLDGRIMVIPDINVIADDAWSTYYDSQNGIPGLLNTKIINVSNLANRYISGLAFGISNNELYVTLGQFGNDNYVFSTSGLFATTPIFNNIQGNLPKMPVFSAAVDFYGNIYAGTEFGLWMGTPNGSSFDWSPQNGTFGNVPVLSVRLEEMKTPGCEVLYIGTYGKGMYRSGTTAQGCDVELPCYPYPGCAEVTGVTSTNPLANALKLYPNPMTTNATLDITTQEPATLNVLLYNLSGQFIKRIPLGNKPAGHHQLAIPRDNLSAGSYLLILTDGNNRSSIKMVVQ